MVRPDIIQDDPSAPTLDYYDSRAEQFWQGTRDHDVTQNIDALLTRLSGPPPFTILDFGCGPGRDLKAFAQRGHKPIGLDGAANFVRMAAEYSGCPVWHQNFLDLDLPQSHFDGIFANASLFHVPVKALPQVLGILRDSLKPCGVLFSSNPHGRDQEGYSGGRFGAYHTPERWAELVTQAGFCEIHRYFRPKGLPREQQPWLATLWRRD
ncbi:SAM-dependent methyltransferase [Paramagnetospirillum magnetotacticum MS-1]|uniref:SAM-dependent methyltransferase n=2 Tax=Paramagnetospirillum magnetotacticum TaxID=188 RepID=A0A0C2V4B0_PARME|nr:SAM-dependent methyltransferase [Paramagnetospirillum magnetotacticum MS-1]